MRTHRITIVASGMDPEAEDFEDRFFEAGCDDATISVQKGLVLLDFAREARTFLSALWSAVADVERAGAKIERIEPDYLVSASEIAERAHLSRSAVSLYAKGERGRDFPPPVARVTSESPLWDWSEVASWMHRKNALPLAAVLEAKAVREVNRAFSAAALSATFLGRRIGRERLRRSVRREGHSGGSACRVRRA